VAAARAAADTSEEAAAASEGSTAAPDDRESEGGTSEALPFSEEATPSGSVRSVASSGGGLQDRPLSIEEESELLRWVPRNANGLPTSAGSVGHAEGSCKPCLFAYHASKACTNGVSCPFCHFEHPPKRRVKHIYRQRRS
jgi:hypothetical protein